ncbi:MAG: hypothetical protein WCV64_06610, partial [Desulfurivibrionaceae bacterium]
ATRILFAFTVEISTRLSFSRLVRESVFSIASSLQTSSGKHHPGGDQVLFLFSRPGPSHPP